MSTDRASEYSSFSGCASEIGFERTGSVAFEEDDEASFMMITSGHCDDEAHPEVIGSQVPRQSRYTTLIEARGLRECFPYAIAHRGGIYE